MTTARTLQPEDQLAHYRVVGPLGAGGMGEVYLAQDQTLERNVALKVLPQELVRSEERVRRFVQEAKSASSLNHPNIITIYEIGQDEVRPASGEASTGSVQYISMELVSGRTLGARIHEEKTDLRTLLGYLAQAAEGIAKAHAAGIVHRDLKPGNIMVSDDGFAKVLDFGLAKLTEQRSGEASANAMTEVGDRTAEGAVLGTVHYMSPEQVQGKSVDHRSDVFSFGCLLYEAATRRRPFIAESNVETMHKILHDKPQPIEEINPAAPAELRRLVRRCLNKAPEQRLQSMKDLALELREIVDEYDALSASATSATTGSGSIPAIAGRGKRVSPVVAGALAVAIAGISYGIWHSRKAGDQAVQPFQNMRAATQTSRGDVNSGALSQDGRYLAYVAGAAGQSTLRVRQVATGSDVEVLPIQDAALESPSFTPDGNYLFYLKRNSAQPIYRSLMRVPSLGGSEEERGFDVDSRATFSPDGKFVCFLRGVPQEQKDLLIVRDLDAGTERDFAAVARPEQIVSAPAWSPDGKRIAAFALSQAPRLQATLVMFDAESGKRDDFFVRTNAVFTDLAWMPDGRGLVLAGTDVSAGIRSQVFMLSYPGARLQRVTNDFNVYGNVSVSGGEGAIATLRTSEIANLHVADLATGTVRRLTSATSPEHSPFGFDAVLDRVLYTAVNGQRMGISVIPMEGGEPRVLNPGPGHVTAILAGGDAVVFQRYDDDAQQHIWRIGIDGTGLRQITSGGGEGLLDLSPDGETVAFTRVDSTRGVWVIPAGGGEARELAPNSVPVQGLFSGDGQRAVVAELSQDGSGFVQTLIRIISVADGAEVVRFMSPPQAMNQREGPGDTMSFLDRGDPARNVFALGFAAQAPVQLTKFGDGRLTEHVWSPDFKRLAVVRRDDVGENVWVLDANGGNARQVTSLDGEDISLLRWSPDSQRIVVRAGRQSRDIVMITNFQ